MVDEEEEEEEGGQRRCLIHAKTKIGSISKIGNKGERLKAHENSEKHRKCQEQAVHFLAIASRKDTFVKEKLNKAYWNKVETNRHSLKTIISVVLICGPRNIPLRGNWDKASGHEDCNFMELLNLRAQSDIQLKHHLMNAPKNAKYVSPKIQNELLTIISTQIRDQIISEVKNSTTFQS